MHELAPMVDRARLLLDAHEEALGKLDQVREVSSLASPEPSSLVRQLDKHVTALMVATSTGREFLAAFRDLNRAKRAG